MTKRLLLALALAMSASALLPAQPPPPPFEMLKNLDLTEAQKQSIQAIFEKHRASRKHSLEVKEQALREAMAESASTEIQLRELHALASEARLAMLLDGRVIMLEIQAVLSPVQRAKAKEQRQKMQKMMDDHRAAMEALGGESEGPRGPFMP